MLKFVLVLVPFLFGSVSVFASSQQQYQLHNNFVKRGNSGYAGTNTQGSKYNRGIRYTSNPIPHNNAIQPTTQNNIQPFESNKQQSAYTGYPHYDGNAQLHKFAPHTEMFKKYYVLNAGAVLGSKYSYKQGGNNVTSVTNNNSTPILNGQGLLGMYVGKKFNTLLNSKFRFEYGGMWEILSFQDETQAHLRDVHQHNVAASIRGFFDFPISPRFDLTFGGDLNYGIMSHIVAQDQIFTLGVSYGIMAGTVMKVSRSKSVFLLLRQGQIPSNNYSILNTTRNANFSATSIIVGIQMASW